MIHFPPILLIIILIGDLSSALMVKNGDRTMKKSLAVSTIKQTGFILVFIISFAHVFVQAQSLPPEIVRYADTVYTNATIVTLDDHDMNQNPGTIVEAMAIRDEVIIGLGTNEQIIRMAGPDTRIVDLEGRTVLPGIVESHIHPMGGSESRAREMYNLRDTPIGYALNMDVAATTDETMARVAQAMELLLTAAEPMPDEWINVTLIHNPELGFATPADVSTLMSAPRIADIAISKEDLSEIVPNYPFVLSSGASVLSAPGKNVWYHITVGPDGQPVEERVIEINF